MECAYESWNYNCSFMMRILENLSTCTMQRINWGLFSRAHCYTIWARENGKGGNEAFPIQQSTCTQTAVCTHTHTHLHTDSEYLLLVTFTHHDTFTQSFTVLNTQWCALFTCVVMFSKSNPINSSGPHPATQLWLPKGVQVMEGCSLGAE